MLVETVAQQKQKRSCYNIYMVDVKTKRDLILGAHEVHTGQSIRECMLGEMIGYVSKTKDLYLLM